MGSLCCVAARPQGSNEASREWSVGPNEPYWRTNTSFSPPPARWDFRIQPEGLSFGSHGSMQLSTSSNSRGSRGWLRANQISNHQYQTSDSVGPYFSSPSEISPSRQWTPPAIQEIKVDDYGTSSTKVFRPLSFSPSMEGTSAAQDNRSSISSRSDSSDYEPMHKSNLYSHCNFPSRRYFMSKPVHPLSFPSHTPAREAADSSFTSYSDISNATPHRDSNRLSSGSINLPDVSGSKETDSFPYFGNSFESTKCCLCERFLSQRSPWSSRRIVKSGDMPIAGILSCQHVFHADCLEHITPQTRKHDPPCPLCARSEEEQSQEAHVSTKLKSSFPKLKAFSEGSSRPWGCVQAGDCVEGALHAPPRNTMMSLNRNRIKKNLSLKVKEYPGKLKKICPGHREAGSSKSISGPSLK